MSELCRAEVFDRDGECLGNVNDVRLVQDGTLLSPFGNALRVDGLIVGSGALAIRLGFHRHNIHGPWLLKSLAQRFERRAFFIPWTNVENFDHGAIRLNTTKHDLQTVAEAYAH
jgi:hypothetical protein